MVMQKWLNFIIMSLIVVVVSPLMVHALDEPDYQSPNFGVDEYFIGPGGTLDATSSNYSARATLGDLGVGNSSSANFQQFAGFTTTDEPFLEFYVNSTGVDLGIQSSNSASTGNAEFYIRNYLSDGYAIVSTSQAPTNGSEVIDPLTSPSTSVPGTEQFGINLVANTAPVSFGSDPVQVPDATFSFGEAAVNYNIPNSYTYNQDDVIATSPKSSGQTNYTISYLMNVSNDTPGGIYTMSHTLVAVATY